MTDRFEVPEPSAEAFAAYAHVWETSLKHPGGLRAAYAVDVPRIVRAEVERALNNPAVAEHLPFDVATAYLAARFPEAAPSRRAEMEYLKDKKRRERVRDDELRRAGLLPDLPPKECFLWCSLNSPGHAGECER